MRIAFHRADLATYVVLLVLREVQRGSINGSCAPSTADVCSTILQPMSPRFSIPVVDDHERWRTVVRGSEHPS
jgi:hypothetical protein